MVWLRVLEEYLVQALLRSPHFHGMVRNVHGTVHGIKTHHLPRLRREVMLRGQARWRPSSLSDRHQQQQQPVVRKGLQGPGFLGLFVEELKKQAWSAGKKP